MTFPIQVEFQYIAWISSILSPTPLIKFIHLLKKWLAEIDEGKIANIKEIGGWKNLSTFYTELKTHAENCIKLKCTATKNITYPYNHIQGQEIKVIM